MPGSVTVGLFVVGAVLVFVALLGGKFKLFGAEVSERVGPFTRTACGILGVLTLGYVVIPSRPVGGSLPLVEKTVASQTLPDMPTPEFVKIPGKDYSLSKTEVTQRQFRAFLDSMIPAPSFGNCWTQPYADANKQPTLNWQFPQRGAEYPVVCVTHREAEDYAKWLGLQIGARIRLPSHAEWEYAASEGGKVEYAWGREWPPPSKAANVADERAWSLLDRRGLTVVSGYDDGYEYSAPAGTFPSNAYGLRDMTGNVYEWVAECEPGNCSVRGGSWNSGTQGNLLVSWRQSAEMSGRYTATGFRVLKE